MSFRVPVWYALAGRIARGILRLGGSERTGPWPDAQAGTVWIHAASLGEAKGVLSLLSFLPPDLALTLTATTCGGLQRLRQGGREAFFLPCDDRATIAEFLRSRRVRVALFLEAEAWPAVLEALCERKIPLAFAAFRSSGRSMRRWRLFSRAFPGWTGVVDSVWTDCPGAVSAASSLGFCQVHPGASLKWAGRAPLHGSGTGPCAALSIHGRDLSVLLALVRANPGSGWLWFPRRLALAPLLRLWARRCGLCLTDSKTPAVGEVRISERFGEVAALLGDVRLAWVSPGHDVQEPFFLGAARVWTGRPPVEVARPSIDADAVAVGLARWIGGWPPSRPPGTSLSLREAETIPTLPRNIVSESYIQKLFAERIGGENYGKSTAIYKFEKIKRAKRAALADFPDRPLVDFGIGENDEMAPPPVREALKREVDKLENRGYADNGIDEYKQAAAAYLKRNFGVDLDPATQVVHAIGSKPAYALLPAAFIDPGDVTLFTVPGYPVASTWTKYLGGVVHNLPLLPENDFFPDLDGIPPDVLKKAKLLVINYPNSPSGKTATREFYEKVVAFAKKHGIVVVQDAAHLPFTHGKKPLSFLETPGALDVGVEVHSMSKGWHMIGWRLGFVAGNALVVKAFGDVKDNSDSGQFKAIQKAAALALSDDSLWQAAQKKYQRRQELLVAELQKLGFSIKLPEGTYFLYAKAPKGIVGGPDFDNAEAASQWLIREKSIVVVPFDDVGAHLRFSVTYEAPSESDERAYMERFASRLSGTKFRF